MIVLKEILLTLWPFLVIVICLWLNVKYGNALNNGRKILENQTSFRKVKYFSPKNIKQKLECDSSLEDINIEKLLGVYRKTLLIICIYGFCGVIYLVSIIVRVFRVFNNHYAMVEPRYLGVIIGSIIMSTLFFYWFFLTPIFEFFQLNKLVNLGYDLWDFFQNMQKVFEKISKNFIKYFLNFFIALYSLYIYLMVVNELSQTRITFWIALMVLAGYQYGWIRFLSFIIQQILKFIIKITNKFDCLQKYTESKIIYLIFKNYTYLSMVFIFAMAADADKSDLPMVAAMGVLFLIDTFISQEKAIQEKIEKTNSQE